MLGIMLCIAWAPLMLHYLRGVYVRLPFIGTDHVDKAIAGTVVLSVICALPAIINRFTLIDYLFYILNAFYLVACYAFFPENEVYLNENTLFCISCVFTYYFVGRLLNIENFMGTLVFFSTFCIFADIFYYIVLSPLNKTVNEVMGYDNMNAAYQVLPHTALLMWSALERFRIWKVLVFVVGSLFMLSCGTRGPFVCMGFFGIVYFFFYMNFRGAIFLKAGIIAIFALLIATLNTTMYFIAQFFTSFGLSTRILEQFVTGDLGKSDSRTFIWDDLTYIMENGDHFWGLGAFGCRNYGIIYPHFLPLDFAVTYGYFVGYLLLFLLFALIAAALWLSRGTKRQVFIVFLFSISIIKLMLSNTFLLEPFFYMLIGACMTELLRKMPQQSHCGNPELQEGATL